MILDAEQLKREAAAFGLAPDAEAVERLDAYASLLLEKNKVMNLTAITEPSAIVTRHFVDSLTLLTAVEPEPGAKLIDIGSGAGFPGLPVKILRPDLDVTLLDGTKKRVDFLKDVASALGLTVNAVHARAEEAAVWPAYREQFDLATARAVADLRVLGEYSLGFLKIGGVLVAMTGRLSDEEIEGSRSCFSVMGGKPEGSRRLTLADGSERVLFSVKKVSQTPTGYPRPSAKMAKKPL